MSVILLNSFFIVNLTYTVTRSTATVNEGSSVTFTVTTTGFGSGTLYYTVEGVSGTVNDSDFSSPASVVTNGGSVNITNNSGSFSLTLSNDSATEGTESFLVRIRTGSTSGTIVATSSTVSISDTSVQTVGTVTYFETGGSSNTGTIVKPSTVQAGMLLVTSCDAVLSSGTIPTINIPSGFNLLTENTFQAGTSQSRRVMVAWKIVTAADVANGYSNAWTATAGAGRYVFAQYFSTDVVATSLSIWDYQVSGRGVGTNGGADAGVWRPTHVNGQYPGVANIFIVTTKRPGTSATWSMSTSSGSGGWAGTTNATTTTTSTADQVRGGWAISKGLPQYEITVSATTGSLVSTTAWYLETISIGVF